MNMTFTIFLTVVVIVCYCIGDRAHSKKKELLTALSDRVVNLEKQLDHVLDLVGRPASDDDVLITGQSHNPND